MERTFSPKRLQQQGKTEEALEYYQERYHESLTDGDPFLSSLYLDEIAETLIIGSEKSVSNQKLSFEQLREDLEKVARLEGLERELKEQAILDVEVTLRKRFPGSFKDTELDEGNSKS